MGEQYLYQKFPFLIQKKRSCLKYIFGLLLLRDVDDGAVLPGVGLSGLDAEQVPPGEAVDLFVLLGGAMIIGAITFVTWLEASGREEVEAAALQQD